MTSQAGCPPHRAEKRAAGAPGWRSIALLMVGVCSACAGRHGVEVAPTVASASQPVGVSKTVEAKKVYTASDAYVEKWRRLSLRALPPPVVRTPLSHAEALDQELGRALANVHRAPNGEHHRRVAERYVRLGILDQAHEHLSDAISLDSSDAAAYDGRARIWRDWGFAHLGLPDARRAVYFAPESAPAYNTLGTIMQALGRWTDARDAYERAARLDTTAVYARANLCQLALLERRASDAALACRQALALQPNHRSARANLAVALRALGEGEPSVTVAEAIASRSLGNCRLCP